MGRLRTAWVNPLRWWIWRGLLPNKRERIALTILLIPTAIGGVLALIDRPSSATLAVERLTPAKRLSIAADSGGGSGRLQAQSAVVALNDFSLDSDQAPGSQPRRLELALPVSRTACLELRSEIGGTCDGAGERPTRAAGALTVEWPSTGKVAVEAQDSKRLQLRPTQVSGAAGPYRALNLRIDAPVTEVSFECTERAGFRLVFSGRVVPLRCQYGPADYRVGFAYDPPLAPRLFVSGLGPWQFEGLGAEAEAWVDRGLLSVGDSERTLGTVKTKVTIDAEQPHKVSAVVGNLDSGNQVEFTVQTQSADSVEVSDDQVLPSHLSKYENYWLLIIGITGGVLLTIYLERV